MSTEKKTKRGRGRPRKPTPRATTIPRPDEYADSSRYLSQLAFAKICGMNQSTISRQVRREGHALNAALVGGHWIDRLHPNAIAYYQRAIYKDAAGRRDRNNMGSKAPRAVPLEAVVEGHEAQASRPGAGGRKKGTVSAKAKQRKVKETWPPPKETDSTNVVELPSGAVFGLTHVVSDGDVYDVSDLTMREVAMRFHTLPAFREHVTALKAIGDYKDKELKYLKGRVQLIPLDLVETAIFPFIDSVCRRLVGNMPKAAMLELVPMVQSQGEGALIPGEDLIRREVSKIIKGCKAEVVKQLRVAAEKQKEADAVRASDVIVQTT